MVRRLDARVDLLLGPAAAAAPEAVDAADEAAALAGHGRVGEVRAVRQLARPEGFGVGVEEVEGALLLLGQVVPVGARVDEVLEQVVQDEALEEALAAGVLRVARAGLEGEGEVGCVQARGVVFGFDGGGCRHICVSVCLGQVFVRKCPGRTVSLTRCVCL